MKLIFVAVLTIGGMAAGQTLTCNGPMTRCGGCYTNVEEYEHDKAICERGIEIGRNESRLAGDSAGVAMLTHCEVSPEFCPPGIELEDVPAIEEDRRTPRPVEECAELTRMQYQELLECHMHVVPDFKGCVLVSHVHTCADKTRILLHDEQENPVYWCHKPKLPK